MEKNLSKKSMSYTGKHLLNHSFYKAWNAGELSKEQLKNMQRNTSNRISFHVIFLLFIQIGK